MTTAVAVAILLAILAPVGWAMVRYAVRTGTLAEQIKQARIAEQRRAASAAALIEHTTPADVAKALNEGKF